MPSNYRLALAWLRCGGVPDASAFTARVTVLQPVNSPEPRPYLRRAQNFGRDADMGNSSGTRFASLSASSNST